MIFTSFRLPAKIEAVLIEQGFSSNYQIIVDRVNNSDTIEVLVEVLPEMFTDTLGSLADITGVLAAENINVKYMYSIFSLQDGKACLIFKVDDCEKAEKVLEED